MKNKFSVESLKQFMDISEIDKKSEVERKQFISQLSIKEDEERTIIANVSTIAKDYDEDVMYPKGVNLSVFNKNPVIAWAHDYSTPPIGKAKEIMVDDVSISMKMEIAKTDRAEEVWQLVKGGFLKACSIGFVINKALYKGTDEFNKFVQEKKLSIDNKVNRIITDFTLLENSICPIGCNSSALITAISSKSIKISDELLKTLELDIKTASSNTTDTSITTPPNKPEVIEVKEVKEVKEEVKEVKEVKEEVKEVVIKACKCDGCEDSNCTCIGEGCGHAECTCDCHDILDLDKVQALSKEELEELEANKANKAKKIKVVKIIKIVRFGSYSLEDEIKKYRAIKSGKII